jgi:hypothetical protein
MLTQSHLRRILHTSFVAIAKPPLKLILSHFQGAFKRFEAGYRLKISSEIMEMQPSRLHAIKLHRLISLNGESADRKPVHLFSTCEGRFNMIWFGRGLANNKKLDIARHSPRTIPLYPVMGGTKSSACSTICLSFFFPSPAIIPAVSSQIHTTPFGTTATRASILWTFLDSFPI